MATVREGIVKGLKYGVIPAALAALIADTDVVHSDANTVTGTLGDTVGTLWDKGKVFGTALGASAAVGGGHEVIKNYMQDKAYGDRVRAAQRAVLAQNNLLTQSTHDSSTKLVKPKNMSVGDVVKTAGYLGSKGAKFVTDIPSEVGEVTKTLGQAHPVISGAGDIAAVTAGAMVKAPLMKMERSATNFVKGTMPALLNTGTNPATRNFSEEGPYFVGMDPSVSENLTGSISDFMKEVTSCYDSSEIDRERLQDFLGAYYPMAVTLERSDFSETPLGRIAYGDFGIFGTIAKGLTAGVSGLKKMRMLLPGRKGAQAATKEVFKSASGNAKNLGQSLSDSVTKAFTDEKTGVVSEFGKKMAENVNNAGKTVSAFLDAGADNPGMANTMVKAFKGGSAIAGISAGAKLAQQANQNNNQGQVAPPQKNVG